ncbi:MAG: hypothetical protein PHF86_08335 [Candidatus Nanoarchaeia archaeon]|nr:hypothetical protein [Candidatus Nanoarchaeia archaeon]
MVLFPKKRPEDSPRLPELPKLDFPSYEQQVKPLYREERPELNEMKQMIRETREQSEIPVRKIIPQQGLERPIHTRTFDIKEEKPLFVKIDKYKQAVNDLEHVKNRLREAEHLLDEIDRIRIEENRELENWRSEINRVKEKLLDVDKKLFEV